MSTRGAVITVLVFVALILLSLAWTVFQWIECRDMGHSIFYCMGHILR